MRQANPDSLMSRIRSLAVGESTGEVRRLDLELTKRKRIKETTEELRTAANAAVHHAKKTTAGEYTVETGDFRTRSYDFIVAVAITRTA